MSDFVRQRCLGKMSFFVTADSRSLTLPCCGKTPDSMFWDTTIICSFLGASTENRLQVPTRSITPDAGDSKRCCVYVMMILDPSAKML